ncbi:MAG: D-alanyl-D-alanine carboxypeptidase family protein [Bacillota bacterium]
MKRLAFGLAAAFIWLCLSIGPAGPPPPENSAVFQAGSDSFMINGSNQEMDAVAYIEKGRLFVPVRYLAEACGLSDEEIMWDDRGRTITLGGQEDSIVMQVGSQFLSQGGSLTEMDAVPVVVGGRVYLPARWVVRSLGYAVEWDNSVKALFIYPSGGVMLQPPAGGRLLLINREHALPENYDPGPLVEIGGVKVSGKMEKPLLDLMAEAKAKGFELGLNSGYRTVSDQKSLFNARAGSLGQAAAEQTVAPSGYSEHHTGLAVDIAGSPAAYRWLESNCGRYGFVQRYPPGKESVTGYAYEPWHFRYVGVAVARFMHEKNIATLEELGPYFGI